MDGEGTQKETHLILRYVPHLQAVKGSEQASERDLGKGLLGEVGGYVCVVHGPQHWWTQA